MDELHNCHTSFSNHSIHPFPADAMIYISNPKFVQTDKSKMLISLMEENLSYLCSLFPT